MRTAVITIDSGVTTSAPYAQKPGHKVVQAGASTIGYDADGRRISDMERVVTYDALGRVVKIEAAGSGDVLAVHAYDPLGRWAGGELSGTAFARFYVGEACLHEEDTGGAVICQRTHVPALLAPSIETRASGLLAQHVDGHENLMLVSDASGAPAERYRYSAFGEPRVFDSAGSTELAASALGLRPCFGGMPYLEGVGLYFTPARHYDPKTGMFLARDPALHSASASPYVFACHDPVNRLDPDGDIPPLLAAGLVLGAIGAVVGVGSVIIRGGDYDLGDVVAAGGIGFAAGLLGGVTFGAVSTWTGGALVVAVQGTSLAGSASVGVGINVASGMVGGAASGLVSGGLSGAAGGLYGGYRSGGNMGAMAWAGAKEHGISSMAGGAVAGGLFGGLMRAGTIPAGGWRPFLGRSNITSRSAVLPAVLGRAVISPYGPVGAAGIGFASGYTGGVTRRLWRGEGLEDAMSGAVGEGLSGAAASVLTTALHPTTWAYWRSRSSVTHARQIELLRAKGIHHQRNVAQYPEFTNPQPNSGNPLDWMTRLNNAITRGNVSGPWSEYPSTTDPRHQSWHEMWQFGQRGMRWSNYSTHGPWTPVWNVVPRPVDPRATNHAEKSK
jgi:RHS repeat-associated protein